MNWQQIAPGLILLLVKLTGTSLFFVFFPQIFPNGNFTFAPEENYSAQIPLTQPRWERYRGNDYWFSEDKDVWLISQIRCRDWKSDLVTLNDAKELEFIINKTAMADYFIGLTYSELTSKWMWIDGQELNINLFPLKTATMEEECAAIRVGVIRPVSCDETYHWICKKTYS